MKPRPILQDPHPKTPRFCLFSRSRITLCANLLQRLRGESVNQKLGWQDVLSKVFLLTGAVSSDPMSFLWFVVRVCKLPQVEKPLVKILTHGDSYDTGLQGLHLKNLCADCFAELPVEIALGLKVAPYEPRILCGSSVQTFVKNLGRQAAREA